MRFRKSIKVGKGIKINLSKSGVSTSFGVRGAHITTGTHGTTKSVGIPGTGISFVEREGYSSHKSTAAKSTTPKSAEVKSNTPVSPSPNVPYSPPVNNGYGYKECPNCHNSVDVDAVQCAKCGYIFNTAYSNVQTMNTPKAEENRYAKSLGIPDYSCSVLTPPVKKPHLIGRGVKIFAFSVLAICAVLIIGAYASQSKTVQNKNIVPVQPTAVTTPAPTAETQQDAPQPTQATPEPTQTPTDTPTPTPEEQPRTWVVNIENHRFHYPGCSAAERIKDSNREEITDTYSNMKKNGYKSCGKCGT